MKLTLKQQRFADEYIILGNATQAAIKAGYSEKTATKIGAENLTKPDIKAYIDERLAELNDKAIAKQDEILKYLTSVMRGEATLSAIADRFNVSVQQIVNLNNIGNPDLIYPGQRFKIK